MIDPQTRLVLVLTAGSLLACLGGGGNQPDVCVDYLDCVDEASPSSFIALDPTYGAEGSCWDMGKDERAICEDACIAGLAACEADADTDSDSDSDSDSDTDSDTDFTVTWNGNGLVVQVQGDTSGFDFGIAETADLENGWFGEDCLNGTASFNLCHFFNDTRRGELDSVDTLAGVVEGQTTLFSEEFQNRLTYVVTLDGGECMVKGHDSSYYRSSPSFSSCQVR